MAALIYASVSSLPKQYDKTLLRYDRRKNAISVVIRALRKNRVSLDHIKKDRDVIATLPAPKFENAIRRASTQWRRNNHKNLAYSRNPIQPACIKERTGLTSSLDERRLAYQRSQKLSATALVKNKPSAPIDLTKEEMDSLVRILALRTDVFPWAHKDNGCDARAAIIDETLKLLGIHPACISRMFFTVPKENFIPLPSGETWSFHVAVCVRLSNGEQVIIDPALDTTKALSIGEWCALQCRPETVIRTWPRVLSDYPHVCTTSSTEACLFETSSSMIFAKQEKGEGRQYNCFQLSRASHTEERLTSLAEYRAELDTEIIRASFPPP